MPPLGQALTGLEPLDGATQFACLALLVTVALLWSRPSYLWLGAYSVTILAASAAGIMLGAAPLAIVALALCVQRYRLAAGSAARVAWALGVLVPTLLLALHLVPGFANPRLLDAAIVSPGAIPYTLYVNFDKTLAGLAILGVGASGISRSPREWIEALRGAAPVIAATLVVVMTVSLAFGHVRFEPRWTPLFWIWAPVNLLGTCMSEEAFFRAFIQREVERALAPRGPRHAGTIAVAVSAVTFGLAHAAGGWRYVLLATLAGTGYAVVLQRTGRIEAAIATHFAVNAAHFLLFTYPALA